MILIQDHEDNVYAFKVYMDGYETPITKIQNEEMTLTSRIIVTGAPTVEHRRYKLKIGGHLEPTVEIPHEEGTDSIIEEGTATWGSREDLISLFREGVPPNNRFAFRDVDGSEYYMHFTDSLSPKPNTPVVTGEYAYFEVEVSMRLHPL